MQWNSDFRVGRRFGWLPKVAGWSILSAAFLLLPLEAGAQADGVRIEARRSLTNQPDILASAEELRQREAEQLMTLQDVEQALVKPTPQVVVVPRKRDQKLEPEQVAALAQEALVRIGWYYLCHRCDNWHLRLSGGYAIGECGVIAGCYHSVDPSERNDMREGYLVVLDAEQKIQPVRAIIAADATMDTVLLRVEGGKFTALALNDSTRPGERAYLYSDPLNQTGYFSEGMINRFYWEQGGRNQNAGRLSGVGQLRMNVSTDWAPGSSGAGVLDDRGNVIGHVATISPLRESQPGSDNDRFNGAVLITLHSAVPARCVRLLLDDCQAKAQEEEEDEG